MTGPEELAAAVRAALGAAGLPVVDPVMSRPRNREHGDWSTNVALALAKQEGRPPRALAEDLKAALPAVQGLEGVSVEGPGFLNFRLAADAFAAIVRDALEQREGWGRAPAGTHLGKADVEFVSSNPTGPMHIGAARWIAVGDALASLLDAAGWDVTREYYLNDAGQQMRLFGESVLAAVRGEPAPSGGYQGAYLADLGAEVADELGEGAEVEAVGEAAYARILAGIRETLDAWRVHFDVFFGERRLHEPDGIPAVIARLADAGHVYEADGATWLKTTAFGDDKDRVLVKADGETTYFAADCAYLADKVGRGFDKCLLLLGADHHGYVRRMEALAAALGLEPGTLEIVIGQLVNFVRDGEAAKMSKRAGNLVTAEQLLEEVGVDAARYTFLRSSIDQAIDFDLDAVVREERDNPVFYVQYSYARIAGIQRVTTARGLDPGALADVDLTLLAVEAERELVRRIGAFPEVVAFAAAERAPHRVARYAEELAEAFHRFYEQCPVAPLVESEPDLARARWWLVAAAGLTLANALGLLGVSAPERM